MWYLHKNGKVVRQGDGDAAFLRTELDVAVKRRNNENSGWDADGHYWLLSQCNREGADKRVQSDDRGDDGACKGCSRRHIHADDCPQLKRAT